MNSPQNKIFIFFEILAIPFGVLQTCCKIQKCKKNNFLLCLWNPCENTFFETSNILYIYIKNSKHVMDKGAKVLKLKFLNQNPTA
jgi:hypothetical protein